MRRVQLNQVEARFTGVGDGLTEIIHDTRDLVQLKRAWRGGVDANSITVFIAQGSAGIRIQGRGRNGRLTARLDAAVRDTTGVPQLNRNTAIFSMNACGDFFPRGDLFRAVQTRRTGVAFSLGRNLRGFGNNQARAGALTVILTH